MIRSFSIRGTVTGFNDGEVILTGNFDWSFDSRSERLLTYAANNLALSRNQYLAGTGIIYRFSHLIEDVTQRKAFEGNVGDHRRLRDTAHLVVRLMSAHNDGRGIVNTEIARVVLRESGNAYLEPIDPVPTT